METLFIELPIPIADGVPDGYKLVLAYAKDDTVVLPVNACDLGDKHNCDWEGCSSMGHVARFSISDKYAEVELVLREKT